MYDLLLSEVHTGNGTIKLIEEFFFVFVLNRVWKRIFEPKTGEVTTE